MFVRITPFREFLKEGTPLPRGKVKWFSNKKGYGFIENQQGEDIFVHYQDIRCDGFKTLKDHEEVEFEVVEGEKGLKAENVIRVFE